MQNSAQVRVAYLGGSDGAIDLEQPDLERPDLERPDLAGPGPDGHPAPADGRQPIVTRE
jgi:hypothetical protein